MRCENCLPLVEAFFDGVLGETDATAVSTHLASCPACSDAIETFQDEQEMYSDYWREAGVNPPQWASVLAVIERDRDSRVGSPAPVWGGKWAALLNLWRLRPVPLAALALAVLVVGLLTLGQLAWRRGPQPGQEIAERTSAGPSPRAAITDASSVRALNGDLAASVVKPGSGDGSRNTQREATAVEGQAARSTLRTADVRRPEAGRENASAITAPAHSSESVGSSPVTVDAARFERAMLLSREMASSSLPALARSPNMRAEMSQHFERMEFLFRSLKNAGRAGAGQTVDVSYEKGLSRRLLNRNVLLRREAESTGNLPLEEMLDRVEPVFAEIANLPEQALLADVSLIEERVRKKGVVALLKAYSTAPASEAVRESF
jgi:anti-sigma factor RsiW